MQYVLDDMGRNFYQFSAQGPVYVQFTHCSTKKKSMHPLTFYHTIPTFNHPEKKAFRKHCGKMRKCWQPSFPPFPTMLSTLSKTKIPVLANFILSSANGSNLD